MAESLHALRQIDLEVKWMWCNRTLAFLKRNSTVPWAVVFFSLTYLLVLAVNAGEVGAAWVQAVGSILALIGAAYLPIFHSRHVAKVREQNILGQMRMIAEDCYEQMWTLSNIFVSPVAESTRMNSYLRFGRDKDWGPTLAALSLIPTTEIPPVHVRNLAVLRRSAEQGAFVASLLQDWEQVGTSHPAIVESLRFQRDRLALAKDSLPWPNGVKDISEKYAQKAGLCLEKLTPPCEPLDVYPCKVYLRFVYDTYPKVPSHAYVQIVFPSNDDHPQTFVLHRTGSSEWNSVEEANDVVRMFAQRHIFAVAQERDD